MPIQRKRVARHILVPDTNILWHEDKSFCVSPKFQQFLDVNAKKYDIDLILPKVVASELQFQQTTSALKALQKANAEFMRMSAIADSRYSHRVSHKKVRKDVERKLQSWMQQNGCVIHESPIENVDWNRLISDAVWRVPPFVEDKNTEKGFRDAIIVETVIDIANNYSGVDLAFISSDKLVRKAATKRLNTLFNCYETIEEFETFLKLSDEELTNDFVRAIQTRARQKFHDGKEGSSCLIYREQLIRIIREQFEAKLAPPAGGIGSGFLGLGGLLAPKNKWEPTTRESVWIRAPQFIRLENENEFFWRSRIIFVQLYTFSGVETGTVLTGTTRPGDQKLRKVEFPVKWKSKVAKNGRFLSMSFEQFEEPEVIFEPITEAEREQYGIGLEASEPSP